MRAVRYLNAVLTIIAILLTLQLWTAWNAPADASLPRITSEAQASTGGIPNAGAQRKQMIGLLKAMNEKIEEQTELLRSGGVRVRVTDASEEKDED